MPVITRAELGRFAPRASARIVTALERHADAAFARWGLTSAPRVRMFMAQVRVESAGLTTLFENMDYTAERIRAVWPTRFPTRALAQRFAHSPQALADQVYNGRLGNRLHTADGWLCRGQGLIDVTGRASFERLAAHMGLDLDETRARLTSDDGMVECAAAAFHMLGCLPFADREDLVGCTRRVNGGLIGLTDRRAALEAATKVWPTIRPVHPLGPFPSPAPANVPAPTKPLRPAVPPAPVSILDFLRALFAPA